MKILLLLWLTKILFVTWPGGEDKTRRDKQDEKNTRQDKRTGSHSQIIMTGVYVCVCVGGDIF